MFVRAYRHAAFAGVAAIALMPALAVAQEGPAADSPNQKANDEIVVTGTLIRGAAPAGAQSITIDPKVIEATGATSTDQLLATVPQNSIAFGNLQTVNSGGIQLTVNRINLRNLPQGIGGSSPTLVLLDGHRMVGEGVKQSYPDPDVIPPDLIERVEVVTDGGSATYGSDAVGGVVNFITKRNFNGFKVGVRQGFADSYSSTDVNFTAGKTWDTGSVYVAYNFARHSSLFGGDRDYVRGIDYATGLPSGLPCSPGNVTLTGVSNSPVYAVNGGNALALSNANKCDLPREKDIYPKETRHSVMAGFRQELGSNIEFEVKGFYSKRDDTARGGPIQGSAQSYGVGVPANPGFPPLLPPSPAIPVTPTYISTGGGSTAQQTVSFDFAPVGGYETVNTKLWAYGITPSLTWNFGHDWRMKAFYNYGQSQTTANDPQANTTLIQPYVNSGAINPYDIAASDPTAISQVLDYTDYGIGKDELSNARITFDGPLFKLPGGDLRVAVGGEYIHEKFAGNFVTDVTYLQAANAPLNRASRSVKSVFGELNIPLVGPENNLPLVYSFTVTAAERYDHYSDFGGNWAPNLGATWKPVSWVAVRARWNRSFQAPSLVQLAQAASPVVGVNPSFIVQFDPALVNPAVAYQGGPIVSVQGTVAPLQPQKARDYNIGIDVSPPIVRGLNLHFTYFNIDYSGSIGTPPYGFGPFFGISTFTPLYIMTPTADQLQTFLANAGASPANIATALATINGLGGNPYIVADVRSRNLGLARVRGFDFGFDYSHEVSFGSVDASFNGSYTNYTSTAADGVTFLPNQADIDQARFGSVARVGANVGDNFRAQVTWSHKSGFTLSAPTAIGQVKVGSFDLFDLFMKYDVHRDGLPPISLTLGVNNIFDKSPPLYTGQSPQFGNGYANGSTIGRLFQPGASINF